MRGQHNLDWDSKGVQTLTVQGRLASGGGGGGTVLLDEAVNTGLQRLAILVRAEALDTGAAVHAGDDGRAAALALS